MNQIYNKKTVLITGGSRGIGAATAKEFASHGYNIIINYVENDFQAQNIRQEILSKYDVKVTLVKADVSQEKDIEKMISTIKKEYETIEIIASSTRIDTVISRLIQTSRPNIIEKIKNKEIILNYDILKNNSYQLKENDIFSIRRYGKYQYIGIKKETKSKNYIIECKKYK